MARLSDRVPDLPSLFPGPRSPSLQQNLSSFLGSIVLADIKLDCLFDNAGEAAPAPAG